MWSEASGAMTFLHTVSSAGIAFAVVAVGACSGRAESACKIDTECPQGSVCRSERCAQVSPDAGTPVTIDAGATTCSSDGLLCSSDVECCGGACSEGRCGPPGASTETPTCKKLYELCQNDCCVGLTCVNGACR